MIKNLDGPELANAINGVAEVTGILDDGDWRLWIPGEEKKEFPEGVDRHDRVQVKMRSGNTGLANGREAGDYRWNDTGRSDDIVGWRLL